jgi:hypothetical protein
MFVKYNRGRPPSRIIFYRDGLSEGEFDRVAREEFRALKGASTPKSLTTDGIADSFTSRRNGVLGEE